MTMTTPKPYRYRKVIRRRQAQPINRLLKIGPDEKLTGKVNGLDATDIEERFARALASVGLKFRFQVRFWTANSAPWQEKEVDFVVLAAGMFQPVEVDGQIGHRTSAQLGRDAIREVLLNAIFRRLGYLPLVRVKWFELETQEMADEVVRRMFR